VAAGRAGHFALVVGVDRVGQAEQLKQHGADIVVKDVAELLDKDAPAGEDAPAGKPVSSDKEGR
jgi:beta-phosphoglucomutase-like phosphatase (HAD superfamily)